MTPREWFATTPALVPARLAGRPFDREAYEAAFETLASKYEDARRD